MAAVDAARILESCAGEAANMSSKRAGSTGARANVIGSCGELYAGGAAT